MPLLSPKAGTPHPDTPSRLHSVTFNHFLRPRVGTRSAARDLFGGEGHGEGGLGQGQGPVQGVSNKGDGAMSAEHLHHPMPLSQPEVSDQGLGSAAGEGEGEGSPQSPPLSPLAAMRAALKAGADALLHKTKAAGQTAKFTAAATATRTDASARNEPPVMHHSPSVAPLVLPDLDQSQGGMPHMDYSGAYLAHDMGSRVGGGCHASAMAAAAAAEHDVLSMRLGGGHGMESRRLVMRIESGRDSDVQV